MEREINTFYVIILSGGIDNPLPNEETDMQTNQTMTVHFGHHAFNIEHLTKMGNLTQLWAIGNGYRKAKGLKERKLEHYLTMPETLELVRAIEMDMGIDVNHNKTTKKGRVDTIKSPLVITKRGRYGCTFAHVEILMDAAKRLDLKEIRQQLSELFDIPIHDFSVEYVRHEICFGDMLVDIATNSKLAKLCYGGIGFNVIPQYSCLSYRLDFYLPQLKLAIEYDEEQHQYQKQDDAVRQIKLENELGCKFIRVKKGNEGIGIIEIYEAISNSILTKRNR